MKRMATWLIALAALDATAQAYPAKPILMIVPLQAGTAVDVVARNGDGERGCGREDGARALQRRGPGDDRRDRRPGAGVRAGTRRDRLAGQGGQAPHPRGDGRGALTARAGRAHRARGGLPGFEFSTWFAVVAPAGTPRAIVDRLQREIDYAARLPEIRARLVEQGYDVAPTTPEALAASIHEGRARMAKIVQDAGIKAD